MTDEVCKKLIEAIVICAMNDYRNSLRSLKSGRACGKKSRHETSEWYANDAKRFLESDWCEEMCGTVGKRIATAIEKEFSEESGEEVIEGRETCKRIFI